MKNYKRKRRIFFFTKKELDTLLKDLIKNKAASTISMVNEFFLNVAIKTANLNIYGEVL